MTYNFRHDRSRTNDITARIDNDKQISQGWGGGDRADLDLRKDDFIAKTVAYYTLSTTRIPSNLTRMRQFQDGDLLVTPHLPEYGRVSVHIVDGDFPSCYYYDPSDDTHQSHRIGLKDSFGLAGEISIDHVTLLPWRAKLQWLRFPVLAIPDFNEAFSDIIKRMASDPSRSFGPSKLNEFLTGVFEKVKKVMTEELRNMPPSGGAISFEGLCEKLLQENGYKVVQRNQYDRQGGDVDLVCSRSRRDTSVFEGGDVTLFVQIKKHKEKTGPEAVNQVLKMISEDQHADGCVMSMADGFTEDAEQLAKDHGIVLLDRHKICGLLVPQLSNLIEAA